MLGLVLGVLYYFVIVLESLKDKKKNGGDVLEQNSVN